MELEVWFLDGYSTCEIYVHVFLIPFCEAEISSLLISNSI